MSEENSSNSPIDVAIVGAGPAGLSAAIYAKQAGYNVVVYRAPEGSLISTTDRVNNFLGFGDVSGKALYENFRKHIDEIGIEVRLEEIQKVTPKNEGGFILTSLNGNSEARTVIYAAGSKPKKLGIAGENMEAVSYCATCDGSFYEGDPSVTVVGGGDSAVEEALYLAELVDDVRLFVRSKLRAKNELVERLDAQSKITVHYGVTPVSLAEDGMEVAICYSKDSELEKIDEPVELSTDTTSGVFVAIGQTPTTNPIEGLVHLDDAGFVVGVHTPGLFVAGDLNGANSRQAIIAAGDGAVAGLAASDYLRAL